MWQGRCEAEVMLKESRDIEVKKRSMSAALQ
jgi:hypothetical protein